MGYGTLTLTQALILTLTRTLTLILTLTLALMQGFVQWRDPEEVGAMEPKFINPRDADRYLMPNGPG